MSNKNFSKHPHYKINSDLEENTFNEELNLDKESSGKYNMSSGSTTAELMKIFLQSADKIILPNIIRFLSITAHYIDSDWNLKDVLVDFVYLAGSHLGNNSSDEDELEEYLQKPVINFKTNLLQWWKAHKITYPHLATITRDFLAISISIIGTSVPVERVFSSRADLLAKKHYNLGKESI
ncbi:5202_t:CDS:2 [Funneliformis geosporum]|nr:5202_t:CDS:2 [Funneliformis geosporum]